LGGGSTFPDLTSDEKNEFNRLLFQEIISNFNQNEEDGTIIIKMGGMENWKKVGLKSKMRTS